MRPTITAVLFVSCLPLLPAQDRAPYSILYTGQLLGYARNPNSQPLNAPAGLNPTPAADQYKALFDRLEIVDFAQRISGRGPAEHGVEPALGQRPAPG